MWQNNVPEIDNPHIFGCHTDRQTDIPAPLFSKATAWHLASPCLSCLSTSSYQFSRNHTICQLQNLIHYLICTNKFYWQSQYKFEISKQTILRKNVLNHLFNKHIVIMQVKSCNGDVILLVEGPTSHQYQQKFKMI